MRYLELAVTYGTISSGCFIFVSAIHVFSGIGNDNVASGAESAVNSVNDNIAYEVGSAVDSKQW